MNFYLNRVENVVGKVENAGYQHFLLFPTIFSKGFSFMVVKTRDCVVKEYRRFLCFTVYHNTRVLATIEKEWAFEKIVGKGEDGDDHNCCNDPFLQQIFVGQQSTSHFVSYCYKDPFKSLLMGATAAQG